MPSADTKFQFNPTVKLLVLNVAALMALGLLMVYSAGLSVSPDDRYTLFGKQMVFMMAGIAAMIVAMRVPYQWLNRRRVALTLLALSLAAQAGVLVFGDMGGGSYRWYKLSLGSLDLSVQPSEAAKLCLIIFFAWFLSREQVNLRHYGKTFAVLAGVLGVMAALIGYQDLGTATLLGLVGVCLLLAGGVRWWHPMTLLPAVAAAGWVLIAFFPYRLQRLTIYLDPWKDSRGAGYQITQSLMALGTGGWFGLGLGMGVQKLYYLPADTTDFIFSIICEEMGLAGGALVILLFLSLAMLGLRVARHAPNRFGYLLSLGIILWISFQAVINIGVATGALPTKGIALPLVSYGGTGLLLTGTALGLLMSVAARSPALALVPQQTTDLPVPATAGTTAAAAPEKEPASEIRIGPAPMGSASSPSPTGA